MKKYILIFLKLSAFVLIYSPSASYAKNPLTSCQANGWKIEEVNVNSSSRRVIWKGPQKQWSKGTILVLHGGGGQAAHFCSEGWLIAPQVNFAKDAINRGFGVLLLNSTNDTTNDDQGHSCGKRFDFFSEKNSNHDLAYIEHIATKLLPIIRPQNSKNSIYMTGLSNGGYMSVRAATAFNDIITAFAPISAGDPYGTMMDCRPDLTKRKQTPGVYRDRETKIKITEKGACNSESLIREKGWDGGDKKAIPVKLFYHEGDSIVDISCKRKLEKQLKSHNYKLEESFVIENEGRRSLMKHLWLKRYNKPLLDFFEQH